MLFQFKVILYSATCYKGKLHTSLPRSSSHSAGPLFSPENSLKKEEAAKICVLSGLVVQFFFLIFYFVFNRRFLDML